MGNKSIDFIATGDSFITRRVPDWTDKRFQQLSTLFKQAEIRFSNLEVTAHHLEGYPSAFSGGTWAVADPSVLKDIKRFGFNLLGCANNHSLDYSYGGLEATMKYLEQEELVYAGIGMNLADAARPKYIETNKGRVALISATSTFHESWIAGEQRPDMKGRPGVNPLRYDTTYTTPPGKLEVLKEVASKVGINNDYNLAVKEGFAVAQEEGSLLFGSHSFKEGTDYGKYTEANKMDTERIHRAIHEAKRRSDYVLVSLHVHEMQGESKNKPPQFMVEFARSCIDEGAHAIIGHGPHILRGMEIYKKRPIFYSLGNFIFQNETVELLPSDFYQKYGLGHENQPGQALAVRTNNHQKGLGVNPYVWESLIPRWTMEDGELVNLDLYPIELGFEEPSYRKGWPRLCSRMSIIEEFLELSYQINPDQPLEQFIRIE